MITGCFAGGKRPGREGDQFRPSSAGIEWVELYLHSPYIPSCREQGTLFFYFFTFLRVSKHRLSAIKLCNNNTAEPSSRAV